MGMVGRSKQWRSKRAVTCYKLEKKKFHRHPEWIHSTHSTQVYKVLASEKKKKFSVNGAKRGKRRVQFIV